MNGRLCGFAAVAAAAVALAGCGSSSSASNSNFAKVINAYYAQPSRCVRVTFPGVLAFRFTNSKWPVWVSDKSKEKTPTPLLDAFVKAGFLDSKPAAQAEFPWMKTTTPGTLYSFTAAGQKTVMLNPNMFGVKNGFCVGSQQVAKIVDFTKPGDMLGHTMSDVNFTYNVGDTPKWITDNPAIASNGAVKAALAQTGKSTMTLMLTNKGWKSANDFNGPM